VRCKEGGQTILPKHLLLSATAESTA
jgi:hypothetical protein